MIGYAKCACTLDISLSHVARRKQRTKHHLLEVARRLFSEKGIYWAKVEDITELADLGKGTFYKYFDSKETIIQVLLEEGLDELLSKTEQAVREAPSHIILTLTRIGACCPVGDVPGHAQHSPPSSRNRSSQP